MADINLSRYIDNDLRGEYARKPYNPQKGRDDFQAGIKRTLEQLNSSTPSKAPNKWWRQSNNIVEFEAKLGGKAVLIEDEPINLIPREQFAGFLTDLSTYVDQGKLDEQIKDALSKPASSAQPTRSAASARAPSSSIAGVRKSVSKMVTNGRQLDEIAAKLKADGRYSAEDIDAVIAEKRNSNS